ncbi:MAG: transposase, partial [Brevinematia bacterium]
MEYIVGESREQILLFPETLDDLISEENPVRFIDLYIDKLDLKLLNFKLRKSNIGRPAYSEKVLLKIYIYGYMNRIRSSRRLENECKRNIELMWLTKRLAPDFKTIADFRKDNKEGIKKVHK